jgi:hypothetical protein
MASKKKTTRKSTVFNPFDWEQYVTWLIDEAKKQWILGNDSEADRMAEAAQQVCRQVIAIEEEKRARAAVAR